MMDWKYWMKEQTPMEFMTVSTERSPPYSNSDIEESVKAFLDEEYKIKREEAQRTHRLVESRPGNPLRNEIDLKRPNVFEPQPIRRPAGVATELRNRMEIRSLRRRRQVAQAHIVDHTTAQRAYRCRGISHGMVSWLRVGPTT